MSDFSEGDAVERNWGSGTGSGKIVKRYTRKTTLTIQGTEVTRVATDDQPAFQIRQDDGN